MSISSSKTFNIPSFNEDLMRSAAVPVTDDADDFAGRGFVSIPLTTFLPIRSGVHATALSTDDLCKAGELVNPLKSIDSTSTLSSWSDSTTDTSGFLSQLRQTAGSVVRGVANVFSKKRQQETRVAEAIPRSLTSSPELHTAELESQMAALTIRIIDTTSITTSILNDPPLPLLTDPIKPKFQEYLAIRRLTNTRKNKNYFIHGQDLRLLIQLELIFCRRHPIIDLVPNAKPLSLIKELLRSEDEDCITRIEEMNMRELELEIIHYRDGLLAHLKSLGTNYINCLPEEEEEKLDLFIRALITILPNYPSALINLSMIPGINDVNVERVLKETKVLSSPFEALQKAFEERGWVKN